MKIFYNLIKDNYLKFIIILVPLIVATFLILNYFQTSIFLYKTKIKLLSENNISFSTNYQTVSFFNSKKTLNVNDFNKSIIESIIFQSKEKKIQYFGKDFEDNISFGLKYIDSFDKIIPNTLISSYIDIKPIVIINTKQKYDNEHVTKYYNDVLSDFYLDSINIYAQDLRRQLLVKSNNLYNLNNDVKFFLMLLIQTESFKKLDKNITQEFYDEYFNTSETTKFNVDYLIDFIIKNNIEFDNKDLTREIFNDSLLKINMKNNIIDTIVLTETNLDAANLEIIYHDLKKLYTPFIETDNTVLYNYNIINLTIVIFFLLFSILCFIFYLKENN